MAQAAVAGERWPKPSFPSVGPMLSCAQALVGYWRWCDPAPNAELRLHCVGIGVEIVEALKPTGRISTTGDWFVLNMGSKDRAFKRMHDRIANSPWQAALAVAQVAQVRGAGWSECNRRISGRHELARASHGREKFVECRATQISSFQRHLRGPAMAISGRPAVSPSRPRRDRAGRVVLLD